MPLCDNDDDDDVDEPEFSIFTLNFRPILEANNPSLNVYIGYSRIWAGFAYGNLNREKKQRKKMSIKMIICKVSDKNNQYWILKK